MAPISTFPLLSALALVGAVIMLVAVELERRRGRRVLATALARPASVERAWVSPPDAAGLRSLFVKPVGAARPSTVASDFEVDEIVRRFWLAGIRIGYERDDVAA